MQMKSLLKVLLQKQIAEHAERVGQRILMWRGMGLGRTGHCDHWLKWYLEISHEDSGWAGPMIGLKDS